MQLTANLNQQLEQFPQSLNVDCQSRQEATHCFQTQSKVTPEINKINRRFRSN